MSRGDSRCFFNQNGMKSKSLAEDPDTGLNRKLEELNEEISHLVARQVATSEILRVIASAPTDLQPVLDAIAENAALVCGATDAVIFLAENGFLRRVAKHGSIMSGGKGEGPPRVERGSVPGRAVVDQCTVHVHDLPAAADEFPLARTRGIANGVKTALAMPLLCKDVPFGAILIRRTEVHPFSDKQIALLKTFADQAVIAIENFRLFQALQTRNRELSDSLTQQTATSEILRVIASSPTDLQPVLNTVAENAARICEANDALIYRVDGQRLRGVADYGPLPGQLGIGPPLMRHSVPSRCIIDRRTIHIHDLAAVPAEDFQGTFLRSHGTRTVLATPLLRQGVPIGVILIRRMEVRPFSDRQIAVLETFADQAVIAVENVRLFQEIQDKNRQLEVANERLKELDRLKSDFVSNVSHELRTPLTAIKGAVDLILREVPGPLNEKQIHYLARVRSNTQHLAGLINDVLDLSKIEEGKIELQAARVSLGGLVHEVMEILRPMAAEKPIELEVITLEPSILVWADRDKITQVLTNLIGNAIKFTPPHGRVTVSSASNDTDWVRVSVSDTGTGISADQRERIFEKFYQIAGNGGPKPKGTGLGLSISKALVELHGGKIWVESEPNGGSNFCFTLPLSGQQSSGLL
jgi:signal transduction histidine kinase